MKTKLLLTLIVLSVSLNAFAGMSFYGHGKSYWQKQQELEEDKKAKAKKKLNWEIYCKNSHPGTTKKLKVIMIFV